MSSFQLFKSRHILFLALGILFCVCIICKGLFCFSFHWQKVLCEKLLNLLSLVPFYTLGNNFLVIQFLENLPKNLFFPSILLFLWASLLCVLQNSVKSTKEYQLTRVNYTFYSSTFT